MGQWFAGPLSRWIIKYMLDLRGIHWALVQGLEPTPLGAVPMLTGTWSEHVCTPHHLPPNPVSNPDQLGGIMICTTVEALGHHPQEN